MGAIIESSTQTMQQPYYKRQIKCPRHYLIKPTVDVFLREPVELLKGVSADVCKRYDIKKTRIKRDRSGQKMLDWKKIYQLEKTGEVINPMVSASFAIEHIYDPLNPICTYCQFRCMEGKGKINPRSIKRLSGCLE